MEAIQKVVGKMNTYLENKTGWVVFGLVVAGILLGKLLITAGVSIPVTGDSFKYLEIARSIGGEYAVIEEIIYPPGYPTVIATSFWWFGQSASALFLLQFAMLGGLAGLVYFVARRHLSLPPLLSLFGGLAILGWPYFVLYGLLIMSEVTYSFLLMLSLVLLLEGLKQKEVGWWMAAGSAIGLTTLVRPVSLLLPFWLIGFVVLYSLYQRELTPYFKKIIIGLMFFVLTLAPWSLYMYEKTGNLMPVSSHLPNVIDKSLELGYEADATSRTAEPSLSEVAQSKFMNLFRFWNPGAGGYQAESVTERYAFASVLIVLYKIGFFVILGLAGLAFAFSPLRLWLFGAIILYTWLLHALLFPFPRYTLPIMPMVILLSTFCVHQLAMRFNKNHAKI